MERPYTVQDLLDELTNLLKTGAVKRTTPIIYSQDDEGNAYQWCLYLPNPMTFTKELKAGEYLDCMETVEPWFNDDNDKPRFTYLCIN